MQGHILHSLKKGLPVSYSEKMHAAHFNRTAHSCTSHSLYAITGWLNLLGQVALTASVDSSLANHISAMWVIYNGHVFSQEELLLCYAGEAPCGACSCSHACHCGMPESGPARMIRGHNIGGDCFSNVCTSICSKQS